MVAITPIRAGVLLAALVLICHAILPFTDYVCYDDLYMINWVQRGDLDSLNTFYSMCGGQIGAAYFGAFAGLGDLVTPFKLAGVAFSLATGWLAWRVGVRSGFLSPGEALLVAAVAVVFPAYKMKGGFVYSVYDWAPAVFLMATLLAIRAEDARTAAGHVLRRGLGLLLFSISFQMMSLLMFYGAFFWLLVLVKQRQDGRRWFQIPWVFCAARFDYLFLPFAYWELKNRMFPTWGDYSTYNKPSLAPQQLEAAYATIPDVLTDSFELVGSFSASAQLALLGSAIALWVVAVRFLKSREDRPAEPVLGSETRPLGLLAFGMVLFFLGTLPYAVIGRTFAAWGQKSTYVPLLPLALGVSTLGILKLVAALAPRSVRLFPPLLALITVCFAASWWHNYLTLQSVQVRNASIRQHIDAHPEARRCSVFFVAKPCPVPRTMFDLHGWEWAYVRAGTLGEPRSYAYNGLSDGHRLPGDYVRKCLRETTIKYSLPAIDPDGPQGTLFLEPGLPESPAAVGLKYLRYKYFKPQALPQFIESAVRFEFQPLPAR